MIILAINVEGWERVYQGKRKRREFQVEETVSSKKVRESKVICPPDTQGWAFLPLRVTTGKGRFRQELVP